LLSPTIFFFTTSSHHRALHSFLHDALPISTPDTGVIAVGGFSLHSYVNYTYSSRETKSHFYTEVNNIVRLKSNGRVDSSFAYNNPRANGFVSDAVQLTDGRIIVVGSFTTF